MMEINLNDDFKEILKDIIKYNSKKLKEMKYEKIIKNLDDLDEFYLLYMNLNRRLIEIIFMQNWIQKVNTYKKSLSINAL